MLLQLLHGTENMDLGSRDELTTQPPASQVGCSMCHMHVMQPVHHPGGRGWRPRAVSPPPGSTPPHGVNYTHRHHQHHKHCQPARIPHWLCLGGVYQLGLQHVSPLPEGAKCGSASQATARRMCRRNYHVSMCMNGLLSPLLLLPPLLLSSSLLPLVKGSVLPGH